jgi:hypothetical protein
LREKIKEEVERRELELLSKRLNDLEDVLNKIDIEDIVN